MNPSTSHHVETNVHFHHSEKETTPRKTSAEQEPSFSPDNTAIEILRKRRLRRGRAIAATQRVITFKA